MSRRIVNVESSFKTGYSSSRGNVVQPQKQAPRQPQTSDPNSIPLELLPTLRTLKGYGKRMHALGGLRGARALEQVIHDLMPLVGKLPEVVDVVLFAKQEAESIRAESMRNASFEQDDDSQDDEENSL